MSAASRVYAPSHPTRLWRQIVDEFPAPIAVADPDGFIVAANRAFRNVMRSENVDQPVHPLDSCLLDAIMCAAATSTPVKCRCGLRREICFECRLIDESELVALVGRIV